MGNENAQEGITVPVSVGSKKDVTKQIKHSKKSVLFINKKGQAHMVPEDLALNHVKNNKGYIVEKSNKDYMKLYKMAVGFDEKIGTRKFSQVAGQVRSIDEVVEMDAKAMVDKEAIEAAKAQKEAGGK